MTLDHVYQRLACIIDELDVLHAALPHAPVQSMQRAATSILRQVVTIVDLELAQKDAPMSTDPEPYGLHAHGDVSYGSEQQWCRLTLSACKATQRRHSGRSPIHDAYERVAMALDDLRRTLHAAEEALYG